MPLDKYPGWAGISEVNNAESAIDCLIANYTDAHLSIDEADNLHLGDVATAVMERLYATIEAQVEIQVNKKAYAR